MLSKEERTRLDDLILTFHATAVSLGQAKPGNYIRSLEDWNAADDNLTAYLDQITES